MTSQPNEPKSESLNGGSDRAISPIDSQSTGCAGGVNAGWPTENLSAEVGNAK
jgi:hypothetical protein